MDSVGSVQGPCPIADAAGRGDERELWLRSHDAAIVSGVVGLAFAIRVYLCLTSYCISGDGVAYLAMARQFADGHWHAALASVYSPLYPLLIALMHRWVTNWEMAGNLLSAILGTGAVATTYLMTREAFGRRDLGVGAALLMALHPEIAAYAASVRTEAGYMFLTTGACWLLLKSLSNRRLAFAAAGGLAAGLAYLYRTEAIGFLLLGIFWFTSACWWWRQALRGWVSAAACLFGVVFMLVAAPYIVYLRLAAGHWSIGREFTAAMMYGMGDVAPNGSEWRRLGWSATVSPFWMILNEPRLYAEKVGLDFIVSIYNFAQALEPLLAVMLAIGIWARTRTPSGALAKSPESSASRTVISSWRARQRAEGLSQVVVRPPFHQRSAPKGFRFKAGEAFLAAIVIFYFCGFALSYTGTRFMLHLIPFVFGWVAAGILALSEHIALWCGQSRGKLVHGVVPATIVLTLLPRTLWPIGYDMRGVRYAGEDIAQRAPGPVTVAARDGRVAYYAGARLVELPLTLPEDACGWLRSHHSDFLMIGNHDEQAFGVTPALHCLRLLKRYPRYGSGYYDLYEVRPAEQPLHSGTGIDAP